MHQASDDIYYTALILETETAASVVHKLGQLESELPGNIYFMVDNIMTCASHQINVNIFWTGRNSVEVSRGVPIVQDLIVSLLANEPISPVNVTASTISWTSLSGPPAASISSGWNDHVWAAQTWTGYLHAENNTAEIWRDIMTTIVHGVDDALFLAPDVEFWGGAIHDKAWHETAFPYRDAVWNVGVLLMIPATLPNAQEVYQVQAAKVNAWWSSVSKYLTGSYVNYPMISLRDDYPQAFWGDNLPRLVKMKQRVDPDNVYDFPMSVPVTL